MNRSLSKVVVVPNLKAVELTKLVESEGNFTSIDDDLSRWDFYQGIDGPGKSFKPLIWKPELKDYYWSPGARLEQAFIDEEAVRKHFRDPWFCGNAPALGNAGAFIEWLRLHCLEIEGDYASVLEKEHRWPNPRYERVNCSPLASIAEKRQTLRLYGGGVWYWHWRTTFVAFHELPA